MIAARQGIIARQNYLVDITLYSSQGLFTGLNGYEVYYSTSQCSGYSAWPTINDCINSTTCAQYGAITIPSNTTVYVTVKECTGTFISFNAVDDTSTCPANEGSYCWDYDLCTGISAFSFNSGTVNKNIAINVFVFDLGGGQYSYQGCEV